MTMTKFTKEFTGGLMAGFGAAILLARFFGDNIGSINFAILGYGLIAVGVGLARSRKEGRRVDRYISVLRTFGCHHPCALFRIWIP